MSCVNLTRCAKQKASTENNGSICLFLDRRNCNIKKKREIYDPAAEFSPIQ